MHEKNISGKSLKIAIALYYLISPQMGESSLVTPAFGMEKWDHFFLHLPSLKAGCWRFFWSWD